MRSSPPKRRRTGSSRRTDHPRTARDEGLLRRPQHDGRRVPCSAAWSVPMRMPRRRRVGSATGRRPRPPRRWAAATHRTPPLSTVSPDPRASRSWAPRRRHEHRAAPRRCRRQVHPPTPSPVIPPPTPGAGRHHAVVQPPAPRRWSDPTDHRLRQSRAPSRHAQGRAVAATSAPMNQRRSHRVVTASSTLRRCASSTVRVAHRRGRAGREGGGAPVADRPSYATSSPMPIVRRRRPGRGAEPGRGRDRQALRRPIAPRSVPWRGSFGAVAGRRARGVRRRRASAGPVPPPQLLDGRALRGRHRRRCDPIHGARRTTGQPSTVMAPVGQVRPLPRPARNDSALLLQDVEEVVVADLEDLAPRPCTRRCSCTCRNRRRSSRRSPGVGRMWARHPTGRAET